MSYFIVCGGFVLVNRGSWSPLPTNTNSLEAALYILKPTRTAKGRQMQDSNCHQIACLLVILLVCVYSSVLVFGPTQAAMWLTSRRQLVNTESFMFCGF